MDSSADSSFIDELNLESTDVGESTDISSFQSESEHTTGPIIDSSVNDQSETETNISCDEEKVKDMKKRIICLTVGLVFLILLGIALAAVVLILSFKYFNIAEDEMESTPESNQYSFNLNNRNGKNVFRGYGKSPNELKSSSLKYSSSQSLLAPILGGSGKERDLVEGELWMPGEGLRFAYHFYADIYCCTLDQDWATVTPADSSSMNPSELSRRVAEDYCKKKVTGFHVLVDGNSVADAKDRFEVYLDDLERICLEDEYLDHEVTYFEQIDPLEEEFYCYGYCQPNTADAFLKKHPDFKEKYRTYLSTHPLWVEAYPDQEPTEKEAYGSFKDSFKSSVRQKCNNMHITGLYTPTEEYVRDRNKGFMKEILLPWCDESFMTLDTEEGEEKYEHMCVASHRRFDCKKNLGIQDPGKRYVEGEEPDLPDHIRLKKEQLELERLEDDEEFMKEDTEEEELRKEYEGETIVPEEEEEESIEEEPQPEEFYEPFQQEDTVPEEEERYHEEPEPVDDDEEEEQPFDEIEYHDEPEYEEEEPWPELEPEEEPEPEKKKKSSSFMDRDSPV